MSRSVQPSRPASRDTATSRRRRSDEGFTLLEVLVALLIFGLIAAASVSVMAYAADNQQVVRERMARLGELQRARALIRGDLAQASARRTRGVDGSVARNAFIGRQPGGDGPLLAFVRRGWDNPDGDPRASMQYVEWRLEDGGLERSARAALDGAPLGEPQRVLSGVRSATLGYRYRQQWNDGWIGGADALPEAIDLALELDDLGVIDQRFLLPDGGR